MHRNTVIFLLSLLVSKDCLAQQYPFVHYTPKDGLVNNRAKCMYQDRRGLLYIATYGGLSVYDGSRFTNYTREDGLSSDLINDIVELGEDSFWIITNSSHLHSLVRGKIGEVSVANGYCPIINKMIRAQDGAFYAVSDQGLFRFENNLFSKIKMTDDRGENAGQFFVDGLESHGKIFLFTDLTVHAYPSPGGLVVYDLRTGKTSVKRDPLFYFACISQGGDIFFSTDHGIKKLDAEALGQNKIEFLPLPARYKAAEKYIPSYMYFDRQDNFWVSTNTGISKIDLQGQETRFFKENGLMVNHHESIFQDRENTMWFMNGQIGISKLVNPQFEFYAQVKPGFQTTDIYANDQSDSVWFLDAIHNKFMCQYKQDSTVYHIGHHTPYPELNLITAMGNSNYICDNYSIYKSNRPADKNAWIRLSYNENKRSRGLTCLLPDAHGNLLALSENITVLFPNGKSLSFPLGYFSDKFVVSANGILWVATRQRKIFKFRIHPEHPEHYFELIRIYEKELPLIDPRSIASDEHGNLWIGTRNDGLFCFHFKGDSISSWKQITTRSGLSDNFISYLHADPEGMIWACSAGGVDRIALNQEQIHIENITRSKNLYEYAYKIQTNKSGVHWVMTAVGLIKIPEEETKTSYLPAMMLREINVGKKRIETTKNSVYLPYTDNNLSFSMATPSFIDEKQVRFSYLLEGSQSKSWTEPSNQFEVRLVGLAPGHYTFRAKSSFINGRYPDAESDFSFIISPPWWQSWWFRALGISILLLTLGMLVRGYYRRKLQQHQLVLEKQQAIERERTRIATDMHDDLGAGLSTIRFLTEKVSRNLSGEISREDIEKMQSTSNDLIDKMNEIIWAMNEENDSLEDLLLYTRSYAIQYCEENGMDCLIPLPENIPPLIVSGETRRNIFLTVKECLHNIVKHAQAKRVEISMEASGALAIRIMDNGIGFQKKNGNGDGNGLRNMQRRMESIGGNMDIQNGNGVKITLNIPLSQT
ncbi:MAG: two-component regulator propeller domain-containing protein [Chitinophagales bacterium]